MTPERYQLIGRLFDEALELAPEQRAAWLAQVCSDDTRLLDDVEKLLANHSKSEKFLSRPALDVAADLLAQHHAPFAPGKQVSHYKILSLLGAGGMGEVYLAEDTRLRRKVALKVLPETIAQDKDRLRRFEQEAFAASALNHPNILTIYEFGAEGETHFLAAELVDGETVRARLQRAPLAFDEALNIAVQTAQALGAAHGAGIIHRDIKPENVMIRNDGIVKVLDFGLAKLVEQGPLDAEAETRIQGLTEPGMIVGTVAYMSPEQGRGKTVDARTDIFSLGVVLFEMLSQHHPFMGETASHTIVAILEKEPPPLAQIVKDVPAEFEQIVSRALAKSADERYGSARALLADLKRLQKRLEFAADLAGESPAWHSSEAETQIVRDVVRRPGPETARITAQATTISPARFARLWTAGALAVALLLGIGIWQWLRHRPASAPDQPTAVLPERSLGYWLTVQKYRDGKPYQSEFQSSGREIFEPGWKFRLNLTSPQEGFLYLLNQEPGGNYRLLFPLASHNNGSAHIWANERFQTNWYVFDDQPGTERFRLVWAAQPVLELEAFRDLVNPISKGRISDPAQIQVVNGFLEQHAASQLESHYDHQNRQTTVRGRGAVLVTLVELEHH
ncbi:MAG TPA: protein kinase [Blastocatellia bacterium]|nr:protein kinase [Blastocatellia bacterium]